MGDKKRVELILKLKELAAKGVGGEKINAEKLLAKLLLKYNISNDDLELDEPSDKIFDILPEQRQIAVQIHFMITNKSDGSWGYKGKKNKLILNCTDAEFILITQSLDFYWNIYKKEYAVFVQAFIQKNKLFGIPPKDSNDKEKMSKSDLHKLASYMNGMERHIFIKRIESPNKHS